MISLTLVTLTRSLDTKTLDRCKKSVNDALVPGAKHIVLLCPREEFHTRMRYETMQMDEYTAVMDDDDIIEPDTLSKCMKIVDDNKLDMLFTDETLQIESSGQRIDSIRGRRSYASVAATPLSAHNLCILRSGAIDPKALKIAEQYGIGIDWLMRTSVAMTGNVGHIAEPLYTWFQHPNQYSKVSMKKFNASFPGLRKSIGETWGIRSGNIKQY